MKILVLIIRFLEEKTFSLKKKRLFFNLQEFVQFKIVVVYINI